MPSTIDLKNAVRKGGDKGILISKDAWRRFKDYFIVDSYNNALVIRLRNTIDEANNLKSFYYKLYEGKSSSHVMRHNDFEIKI